MRDGQLRPVEWVGSSHQDFCDFPDEVQDTMGYALYRAQLGKMHPSAKPLKGFGGAAVVEIVDSHRTDTFRAVYTVRFAEVVYVLHALQKKAKKGVRTPKHEIDTIHRRLRAATEDYHLRWKQDGR